MRNLAITILTLFLLTLLPGCSGHYPIESEDDMRDSNLMYQDPFEERARGQNQPDPSKVVEPIAPRLGPWSGNNQLGQSQAFAPDANNQQSILKLDEWGMPEVWSVMLGLTFNEDTTPSTARMDLRALLSIGSGGSTQQVLVDWKHGTVICAPMNALDVVALYRGTTVDLGDADLRLTATLGQGCVDGVGPTLTEEFIVAASPDSSALIPIPAYAGRVSVISNSILGATPFQAGINLAFYDIGGTVVVGAVNGVNLPNFSTGIPIPSRAKYAQIVNNGVAAIVTGSLIFHLDL